jgi:preprotein translocase SecF subunit
MEFFKKTNINFIGLRWYAVAISCVLIVLSIYKWVVTPDSEKFGVDFIGGVEVIAAFDNPFDIAEVRKQLEKAGIEDAMVQVFTTGDGESHNRYSIRLKAEDNPDFNMFVQKALNEGLVDNQAKIEKFDQVGPVIGGQIRKSAWYAVIFSLIGITVYVTARFEFRFALGALLALAHDVIVATGACLWTGRELNTIILAGLLTIVGYSINDTIVIFDRVRENMLAFVKSNKSVSFADILNISINETLSRTIITTVTTLFVVLVLFLVGGGALSDFAFLLLIGFIAGSYSTIFVAGGIVYWFSKSLR